MNNYAFIDTQNVNLWVRDQGWKIDWKKFLVYLRESLHVTKAYLFLGYVPKNEKMYSFFRKIWYTLIFKPVLYTQEGKMKGNVDAELVLWTMINYSTYHKAIIVTWDGDFACLVGYLYKKQKLARLIVPNERKYSVFLQKTGREQIDGINNMKSKLQFL